MLMRIVYLFYYLKQLDFSQFNKYVAHVKSRYGVSRLRQVSGILNGVFRYNISVMEYFQFRFFEIAEKDKELWAGTGYMYEYQRRMNPVSERQVLEDKRQFLKAYAKFVIHQFSDLSELLKNESKADEILTNPSGKIVFKAADGKCGAEVEVRKSIHFNRQSMIDHMKNNGYDLVEEFIVQHADLNRLSPSAVNTIRIFTQLNYQNEVDILGCRLRISINSVVDNMAAGNMAAMIDEKTGIVTGEGIFSDITKSDLDIHPVTSVKIKGFLIPYWNDVISMVKEAALMYPQNRSIGWDVVVTEKGPGLIEGNHDWCKLLWQLPMKQGMKPVLERHLSELNENI